MNVTMSGASPCPQIGKHAENRSEFLSVFAVIFLFSNINQVYAQQVRNVTAQVISRGSCKTTSGSVPDSAWEKLTIVRQTTRVAKDGTVYIFNASGSDNLTPENIGVKLYPGKTLHFKVPYPTVIGDATTNLSAQGNTWVGSSRIVTPISEGEVSVQSGSFTVFWDLKSGTCSGHSKSKTDYSSTQVAAKNFSFECEHVIIECAIDRRVVQKIIWRENSPFDRKVADRGGESGLLNPND